MPKRTSNATMKCHVCQSTFLTKSTRQKYCSKKCAKTGVKKAVDRQTARRDFAKQLGLKRSEKGFSPKLNLSKEAWRIVSDPKLTMKEKYERLPAKDKRCVIDVLNQQKSQYEGLLTKLSN